MTSKRRKAFRNRFLLSVFLIVAGLTMTGFLAVNVTKELRLLGSAQSDNVQWTLSQTEVEYLEFEQALGRASQDAAADLTLLRREFDVFFSRINTLDQSPLYQPLREAADFDSSLKVLREFLDQSAKVIDGSDAALTAALPELVRAAAEMRSNVRRLSISGLNFFANDSDLRRKNIARTLLRLALVVSLLTVTLLALALYLGRLNRLNIRRSKEAIQASERMNTVIRTALDAVIVTDKDGVILDFNAAAEQAFGYAAQDATGTKLADLIVPAQDANAGDFGAEQLHSQGEDSVVGKGRVKLHAKRANGEVFPIELAMQSAETVDGGIFVSFLRDISHRVAVEQDLVMTRDRALAGEKAKTDFLATMSHEIRTPLNGLLGNLSLLQDTALTSEQSQYIKNMNVSGTLLKRHISDVLDITKYDAGKFRLRPVAMNISTLVQGIVDNQSPIAGANNTTVSWAWQGPANDWIEGDDERIQHVLMNIVGNAVKFTPDGTVSIELSTLQADSAPQLQITVTDTGIGIDPELTEEIFGDFMTGDNSYDRDLEGTGLGLGIARRFVTAMGGQIDVQSTQGVGSSFVITFPVKLIKAPAQQPKEGESAISVPPQHVLLVEDNEINRMVAREMLRAEGHRVTEAPNGQIAVEMAQAERFDLILMDISMPVMDGRTATRAIRAGNGASAQTHIVALTANAVAEEQQAFLTDGMNDVITKPISRKALVRLVSSIALSQGSGKAPAPVVNQHLEELRDLFGVQGANEVIARFVKEMDEVLAYLQTHQAAPFNDTAARAHKAAGSAATVGADDLRAALLKVEAAAKDEQGAALARAVDALPAAWSAFRGQLDA